MRQICWITLVLALAGCSGGANRVQGKLVDNGTAVVTPEGEQLSLVFHQLGAGGKPEPGKLFPASLAADGTFQVLVSGGDVPPGQYMITLDIMPIGPAKTGWRSKLPYQGKFALPDSPLRAEVKGGSNVLTVDLSKR